MIFRGERGFVCQNVSVMASASKWFHYFLMNWIRVGLIDSSDCSPSAAAAVLTKACCRLIERRNTDVRSDRHQVSVCTFSFTESRLISLTSTASVVLQSSPRRFAANDATLSVTENTAEKLLDSLLMTQKYLYYQLYAGVRRCDSPIHIALFMAKHFMEICGRLMLVGWMSLHS